MVTLSHSLIRSHVFYLSFFRAWIARANCRKRVSGYLSFGRARILFCVHTRREIGHMYVLKLRSSSYIMYISADSYMSQTDPKNSKWPVEASDRIVCAPVMLLLAFCDQHARHAHRPLACITYLIHVSCIILKWPGDRERKPLVPGKMPR